LTDLAAEIARQSGQPVIYKDLPEAEFKGVLVGVGLPEGLAALLSDSDAGAAKGALQDEGRQLGRLIGRATTPLAVSVAAALKG
ncbi:MAG: KR domain-containing protein, partial [Holophaga sp.]|nr:KR domain-containing protein [Holophaga sp.]